MLISTNVIFSEKCSDKCLELKKFSGVLEKGHGPKLTVYETDLGKSCTRGHDTVLMKLENHILFPIVKTFPRLSAYNYFKSEKILGNLL